MLFKKQILITGLSAFLAFFPMFGADKKKAPKPPKVNSTSTSPNVEPVKPAIKELAVDQDELNAKDALKLVMLQRDQLRKFGEYEHARAEMLQNEKDANRLSGEVSEASRTLNIEIQRILKDASCLGCQISDTLKLIRPIPSTVTVEPNAKLP